MTKATVAVSVLSGMVGAFVAILIAAYAAYFFIDFSFLLEASCGNEKEFIYCFIDEKWDSATYLSVIDGFYSTIIAVLMGLLGAVVAFAFFSIRGSALQRAEETIEKEVDRYFETEKATEKIHKSTETVSSVRISAINQRLDVIEAVLDENEILVTERLEVENEEEAKSAD